MKARGFEADDSLTNTRQISPSGCILTEFYAAFLFCAYPLFPIRQNLAVILVAITHILSERMCGKNIKKSTFDKSHLCISFSKPKLNLLVQLKVTLTIKTIKICRPRARFELIINVLHFNQGFQDY